MNVDNSPTISREGNVYLLWLGGGQNVCSSSPGQPQAGGARFAELGSQGELQLEGLVRVGSKIEV
jgi:hypothetical protein